MSAISFRVVSLSARMWPRHISPSLLLLVLAKRDEGWKKRKGFFFGSHSPLPSSNLHRVFQATDKEEELVEGMTVI